MAEKLFFYGLAAVAIIWAIVLLILGPAVA